MRQYWGKLKVKWNIESDRRMVLIFFIFAITGSSITLVRKPITNLLFGKNTYGELVWYELIATVVFIYFIYQFFLFIIGTLLGEHKFVKWFLLKMNKRMFPFLRDK
jgi:hypothetical protein